MYKLVIKNELYLTWNVADPPCPSTRTEHSTLMLLTYCSIFPFLTTHLVTNTYDQRKKILFFLPPLAISTSPTMQWLKQNLFQKPRSLHFSGNSCNEKPLSCPLSYPSTFSFVFLRTYSHPLHLYNSSVLHLPLCQPLPSNTTPNFFTVQYIQSSRITFNS